MTSPSAMPPSAIAPEQIRRAFQDIWGYSHFRSPQGEIVQALLNHQDALIVMPTGGGKSICFQLPALLQRGVTLVISPLVALMENQAQELQARQLAAAVLHSEQSKAERRHVLIALERQQLRLLYLSPETLLSEAVWSRLQVPQLQINGLILDEAHCLVQWGETFRPTYERLGAVRPALLRDRPAGTQIPIAAFTATASPADQDYIARVLALQTPCRVQLSPYRSHLSLLTQTVWTAGGRYRQLLQFLRQQGPSSGLVYVRSRATSMELAAQLQQKGYRAAAYHAGLPTIQRRQVETEWLNDRQQFVVCTSAFGMGINKSNVRWIVHFHAPQLLSEYVQEVGRAGRDGQRAIALTLISEPTGWLDADDQQRHQFFTEQGRSQRLKAAKLASQIPPAGDIRSLARAIPGGEAALGWLHRYGQLEWLDPFHYRLSDRLSPPPATATADQTMQRYLRTRQCRWQFILREFGLEAAAAALPRCLCDNCRRR